MLSRFVAILLGFAVACGGSVDSNDARDAGADAAEATPARWFCTTNADGSRCVCFDHSVLNHETGDCPPMPCCVACADSCTCTLDAACDPSGCEVVDACPIVQE